MSTQARTTEQAFKAPFQELRAAAPSAGIDLPELHVNYGEPGEQRPVHLGRVDYATAREPARIIQAQPEPFPVGSAVVDTLHTKVGKVLAIHGECLVLGHAAGNPWDALAAWCRSATPSEALSLAAFQKTANDEGPAGNP